MSSHPHLQLISSHLMFISSPCHLISISSHLHLHLISSPYPSHLISISSHLHVISPSHLHLMCISSHLISSHLVSSHLISSHLISSHFIKFHLTSPPYHTNTLSTHPNSPQAWEHSSATKNMWALSPQLKAKVDEMALKWASVTQKTPFEYQLERIDKGEAQHGTKRAPRQGTAPQYTKNAMSGD